MLLVAPTLDVGGRFKAGGKSVDELGSSGQRVSQFLRRFRGLVSEVALGMKSPARTGTRDCGPIPDCKVLQDCRALAAQYR